MFKFNDGDETVVTMLAVLLGLIGIRVITVINL